MSYKNRPLQITAILTTVGLECPPDMGSSLETYISDLESHQQAKPDGAPRDPVQLYWHSVKRQQSRLERAMRKSQQL